jgi:carboxyl-terminal processing protease
MAMSRTARAAGALLLLVLTPGLLASEAKAALQCGDLPDFTTFFFQKHVEHRKLTPAIRDRAVENYLRALDPQRVLFLAAEADAHQRDLRNVFHETRAGDCRRLRLVHEAAVARSREVEGFVRGYVGDVGYALDESATLVVDPEDRGHPANAAERDALLRALVHFQISNYTAGDMELEQARGKLIHRYELRTKRTEELEATELYALFLDSFARALDPHSSFLSAEIFEDFRIQMQLSLEGIGVALSEEDGFSIVREIIPGGATDRAKALEPADRIIAVAEDGQDSVDIIDMSLSDVVRLVRGKKGTKVHLTVLRDKERLQVTIVRDRIDLEQQAAQLDIREVATPAGTLKLAVLDLPSFYGDGDPRKRQGSRDVRKLLFEARKAEVDGLVLDLSRNGGGLLEDAVKITGFFLRDGGVVSVRDTAQASRVHKDPDRGILYSGPMVVLTSRVSASASEILAGAMKDYGRAVIVGDDHTFGKGTVQSMLPLGRQDAGAIKVTTGLFFRPGGDSTQLAGVRADVVLPSLLANDRIGEAVHENALSPESIPQFRTPQDSARPGSWKPVAPSVIGELGKRSALRVAEDEAFQEILTEIAKRDEDDGVLRLAEIIEKEDRNGAVAGGSLGGDTASTDSDAPGADDEEEEPPSPHLEEALHILTDLIQLTS